MHRHTRRHTALHRHIHGYRHRHTQTYTDTLTDSEGHEERHRYTHHRCKDTQISSLPPVSEQGLWVIALVLQNWCEPSNQTVNGLGLGIAIAGPERGPWWPWPCWGLSDNVVTVQVSTIRKRTVLSSKSWGMGSPSHLPQLSGGRITLQSHRVTLKSGDLCCPQASGSAQHVGAQRL